ncbi:YwpF-like family protein [Sporosarcina aquimarina]|uniref:YwpF-like family protein n=1 Tax=Sporosarcina aquimarina TaxID=114975 RepID=UPI00203BD9D4|nr:YwpF-like family protein [Sporosarcina aquimarina]MCM3756100.1 YwpF-like family protein [Sporosarcina aquimarina]
MKTFKMISFGLLTGDEAEYLPMLDGIIINQENSHRMWILEMFLDMEYKERFEKLKEEEAHIEAKVVISYPENEPAAFVLAVDTVHEIGDRVSVLLKGRLKRQRSEYAEQLLSELLDLGFEGQALLERFESDMRARPRLKKK